MVKIKLPGGIEKSFQKNITVRDVSGDDVFKNREPAIAGKLNSRIVDLDFPIESDTTLDLVMPNSNEGMEILRHSAAHLMAQAVTRLYPNAKLGIGPSIKDGFYYDFDLEQTLSQEDLEKIEEEMLKIAEEDLPYKRLEEPRTVAIERMEKANQSYKVELIKGLEDETVSFYQQGDFIDLCKGPHVSSTKNTGVFKLLSLAGAYWRGKETNPMLQRIYGTVFTNKKALAKHLKVLEEIKKRDHRKIGTALDLYSFHDKGGPGLVFWHPKGAAIRNVIETFWRSEHYARGYDILYSPHIAKIDLWKTSGHLDYYKDSMFSPIEVEGQEYILRPMNCPFAILMYQSSLRSYRDLPLRWGELGTVYRYERSGVLHGLLRVRGFTQDDAHIFCRPDQLQDEIEGVLDLALFMLNCFGFDEYEIELAVRGKGNEEKYIGENENWILAEEALTAALNKKQLDFARMEDEAKFYGPAIDIKTKDALGRGWQGPTIQVDFNLPERFDINYIGSDGIQHKVVMLHRTVIGAMERFLGCLIEHHAGNFPLWLAPIQVRVLPISDKFNDYALETKNKLSKAGIRTEVDTKSAKIGFKIREGTLEKIPYLLIVGEKEVEDEAVSVRSRKSGNEGPIPLSQFILRVEDEVRDKA
ncbi:MAG: threonine--tRNA ligase [Candidatus Scalindua sp. AMX11]|nr:MAG: threonine--tRNA ligase [Candidatus Scalindua sp.]NOG85265.1 threonine--tRNA ligase [Planctomycetota bacterium]RZV81516.1 MAG: threonine--tRNA ligase [Candidatus Scalindua sp. SCAELEC01]TDE65411.1 MAG: threonine--tRNA ligase [Candidatus Scalindua sp. AMX11]GJQ59333.1 MAG: threonine--tRNA ligase [Candidatus Scalindua sp.]